MRERSKTGENPELDLSFSKQNRDLIAQESRLNIQILRVHTIQKQRALQHIWNINQIQLCQFFTNYPLFPQQKLEIEELLNSSKLKLIKSQGKIYFGIIERKRRVGKGINIHKDGSVYEGQFADNQKSGWGIEIYPNGNLYIGQYLNNKKHGKGTFYWFSLSSKNPKSDEFVQYYEGQWWGGLPDGEGLHLKINGDMYTGIFKNGLKHGEGIQYYSNGQLYKGEFINGMPEGFGQYVWEDGSFLKGNFKQGLRNGYGVWNAGKNRNQTYKGHYVMDKKSGHGLYVWENGWFYKGGFDNDYRHGYGELYDSQNNLNYRGFWENGEQTDRQVINQNRDRENNMKSMQFARVQNKKQQKSGKLDVFENKKRTISNLGFHRQEMDFPSVNVTQYNIKKRPLSHNANKTKRNCMCMNKSNNKLIDNCQQRTRASSTAGRTLVGTIKSNLFVPFRYNSISNT